MALALVEWSLFAIKYRVSRSAASGPVPCVRSGLGWDLAVDLKRKQAGGAFGCPNDCHRSAEETHERQNGTDAQGNEIRKATAYDNGKLFEYPAFGEALTAYPELPDLDVLLVAATSLVENLSQPCGESQ